MNRLLRQTACLAAACVTGVFLNGCALIPIAALGSVGSVADIGSAAFSTGTEVFSAGQLESVEFCTFEQGQAAVRSTLNDLRLKLKDSSFDKETAHYRFRDLAKSEVDIDLQVRSSAVCQFRVDVGMFGSEAYARLLLKSVRSRLPIVSRQPTTQAGTPRDLRLPQAPATSDEANDVK